MKVDDFSEFSSNFKGFQAKYDSSYTLIAIRKVSGLSSGTSGEVLAPSRTLFSIVE
jgi:hypothetical protein